MAQSCMLFLSSPYFLNNKLHARIFRLTSNHLQDLSSAPRLSPSHSRGSSSLRDSWFDVEWRPPPGLEGLGPSLHVPDSPRPLAMPPGNRSSAIASSSSVSHDHEKSALQFRQPEFSKESDSRIIKTPPPPSRAAMAAAKRFFLSKHSKDTM